MCRRSANRGYKRGSVLVFQNVPLPQQGTSQKSCKQEIPPARRRLHSPPANNAALLSHDRVQRRQRCAIRRLSNTPCPPPTHEHLDGSAMSSFRFLGTGRVQGLFFVIFQVPPVFTHREVGAGRAERHHLLRLLLEDALDGGVDVAHHHGHRGRVLVPGRRLNPNASRRDACALDGGSGGTEVFRVSVNRESGASRVTPKASPKNRIPARPSPIPAESPGEPAAPKRTKLGGDTT